MTAAQLMQPARDRKERPVPVASLEPMNFFGHAGSRRSGSMNMKLYYEAVPSARPAGYDQRSNQQPENGTGDRKGNWFSGFSHQVEVGYNMAFARRGLVEGPTGSGTRAGSQPEIRPTTAGQSELTALEPGPTQSAPTTAASMSCTSAPLGAEERPGV